MSPLRLGLNKEAQQTTSALRSSLREPGVKNYYTKRTLSSVSLALNCNNTAAFAGGSLIFDLFIVRALPPVQKRQHTPAPRLIKNQTELVSREAEREKTSPLTSH